MEKIVKPDARRENERKQIKNAINELHQSYINLIDNLCDGISSTACKTSTGMDDASRLWKYLTAHGDGFSDTLSNRTDTPVTKTANKMAVNGIGKQSAKVLIFISAKSQELSLAEWLVSYARFCKPNKPLPVVFQKYNDTYKMLLDGCLDPDEYQVQSKETRGSEGESLTITSSGQIDQASNENKWQKRILSYAIILFTLLITGFTFLWWQGQVQSDKITNQITQLVLSSKNPIETKRSVNFLLQNEDISREAIISSLIVLGANPNISASEIPMFFENFAKSYLELKNNSEGVYTSQSAIKARDSAQIKIDKGSLEDAEEIYRNSISSLEKQRGLNAADLVLQYTNYAYLQTMQYKYKSASEIFLKAAQSVEDNTAKKIHLRYLSIRALAWFGGANADVPALKDAILKFQNLVDTHKIEIDKNLNNKIKIDTAVSIYLLSRLTGDTGLHDQAESLSRETVSFCENIEPNIGCYKMLSKFLRILRERGLRSVLYDSGWQGQKKRLEEGLKVSLLAKRHAENLSISDKVAAMADHQLTIYYYSDFIGDSEGKRKSEKHIYKQYRLRRDNILKGKYIRLRDAFITIAISKQSNASKQLLLDVIALLEKKSKNLKSNTPYSWAENQESIAMTQDRLWRMTKDIKYLNDAIKISEKAFEFMSGYTNGRLAIAKLRFATLVSDYGRETSNVETLEKAVQIFKQSVDDFEKTKSVSDRQIPLEQILVVISRLEGLGERSCWQNVRKYINQDLKSANEFIELSRAALERQTSPGVLTPADSDRIIFAAIEIEDTNALTGRKIDECFGIYERLGGQKQSMVNTPSLN